MKKTKIAINGFGRIGRLLFRQVYDSKNFEVVAVNDLGDIDNLAYLLKYDTVYGQFPLEIRRSTQTKTRTNADKNMTQNYLVINNKRVLVFQEKDPTKLPWKKLGIDVVVEATGAFCSFEKAKVHLKAGAKKVVITAPAKDEERSDAKTILLGINEKEFKACSITSNGSCTTNAVSPVAAIMDETIGIKKAILNTIHSYTATQGIVDGPLRGQATKGKDFRKGRAGAQNIIPSTTGAAIAMTRAFPKLQGKFDGVALRVPTIVGSLVDFTFIANRKTSVKEINDIFKKAVKNKRWDGILKVTEDQIVSSDIIGEPYGAIIDLKFTQVVDGDLVKIFSWYDNEAGYVATLIGHIQKAAQNRS
ncbi:type I glyceraldehyde-3-phosphate dehydrogenase [Patescibacteria group bacterium]|nr:type I glyceraldehyde-3-phosphate dehydrogenase [Patescibacteria group bacterium]